MGMVLGITQLDDRTIERLVADPPLVWLVVAGDDREQYERARQEERRLQKPGFIARLFGAAPPPPQPDASPFALGDGEGKAIDVDKSWHGMHYLLTRSGEAGSPPLDFLLGGGRTVGDEDVGYGPAWVFTAAETRGIAAAVAAVSDEELRARYDPSAMDAADVYPSRIWVRDGDEALDYVMEYITMLRGTLAEAVEKNRGLMLTLT
jgi:uncharacterized protein DUF1877